MIKVMIADDHPILMAGLIRVLHTTDDIQVTAEASNVEDIVKNSSNDVFDVIVMDLVMPKRGGIWAIMKIKELNPATKIIVFSASDDKASVISALKLGADGYVSKQSDIKELVNAIYDVYNNKRFISPIIENEMKDYIEQDSFKSMERLSKRELQTLALAGEGKSLTEISEKLDLSIKTISTYKSRIFDKLGCKNSNELIRFAIDNNLKSEYFIDEDEF